MDTLNCFVITPSGKNQPMPLVEDAKDGLSRVPSSCVGHAAKVISVNFQDVYQYIICDAIDEANRDLAPKGLEIKCTRGEDLTRGGNIVSQFLQQICRAEITITDVTGLNPNVMLEYGIRLSIRDSLNIVLCHRGVKLPLDIVGQRFIEYTQEPAGVKKAVKDIVAWILAGVPALQQENPESADNLFRRTVEVATGRHLERRLAQAFKPAPGLATDLVNELQRIGRIDPRLRDRAWSFLQGLAETLHGDPLGREGEIEMYVLLTKLDGFRDKRRDAFYKLNEICATDPSRKKEAEEYLKQAKALED